MTAHAFRAALLVTALLVPCPAGAQEAPPTAPAAASQASLTDIGKRAEEVAARLRQMTESLSDTAAVSALEGEVAAETHRIAEQLTATGRLLERRPRITALESLASSWLALRSELEHLSTQITARARRREADVEALTKLHESWSASLELARKAEAPAFVLERAQATLAAIEAIRPAIEQRRAQVLVLQDTVSRLLQECDDALGRIGDAHREAIERVFVEHGPPVWRVALPSTGGPGIAEDVTAAVGSVRVYVEAYRVGFLLTGLLCLVLIILMRRTRAQIESVAERDPFFASAASVFRAPHAAAILLTIVLSRPLRPNPPVALQQLILVVGMAAAILVLRPLVSAQLAWVLYGFAAVFAMGLTSDLLELTPRVQQITSIIEMAATAGLLLWAARALRDTGVFASRSPRLRVAGTVVARVLAFGCMASAAAAVVGYVALADFLGIGLLYLAWLAIGLVAFRVAAEGLVAIALAEAPLARLRAVARHRALVERRIGAGLDVFVVAFWISFALFRFGLVELRHAAARRARRAAARR